MSHFLHFVWLFTHAIVILMETRVPRTFVDKILVKSYFTDYIVSEANGFASGIWILWDASILNVEPLTVDDQVLNVLVKRGNDPYWFPSTIYASPKPNFWNNLCHYLSCIGTSLTFPWLLTGDFNHVLRMDEKRGGVRFEIVGFDFFRKC